jgi:hypothetical protein
MAESGARVAGVGRQLFSLAEINAAIAASPRINAHGMAQARKAVGIWQGFAPVFDPQRSRRAEPPYDEPGAYRESIRISVIHRAGRIAWRVGTTYFTARWLEFGTRHIKKRAPREKTIAAMKHGGS